MEDDDEFGELYADVLRPIATPLEPRPDPVLAVAAAAVDDLGGGRQDGISFGESLSAPAAELPSISHQALAPAAAAAAEDNGDGDWIIGGAPLVVDPPENWDEEDAAASSRPAEVVALYVPEESEPRVLEDDEEEARVSGIPDGDGKIDEPEKLGAPEEDGYPLLVKNSDDRDETPVIPGLSAGPVPSGPPLCTNSEEGKPSQSEDWDSDSEDDLQIVLNDSNHRPLGAERNDRIGMDDDEDDDGEEDLVIVTDEDQHHHVPAMEEQDWGEEGMQPTGDGEKKETVEVAKVTSATGTALGTGIGYINHGFRPQHHSMYKSIRPGTKPLAGGLAAGTAGPPGAARPPLVSGPIAGGGRGDWRPAGGRGIPGAPKNYHAGFGFPAWTNSSVRAFGSGLDFTLPAHKTVFDIDIESFEEKPWKHPGVDISDFFNFGLDEDKWKDYCKLLDQLRLESTMQSKIRVYESSRSEQEYDPDLPPELAAAAGRHDISADNGHGKSDDGEVDLTSQRRVPAVMRAPLPIGRAIQVESGYAVERLPSIDTRPPRIRDSDAVIEIVLQDSFDDPKMYNCIPEQPEKNVEGDDSKDFHEVGKDDRNTVLGYMNHFPHTSSGRNKKLTRRVPFAKEKDEALLFRSESSAEYHQDSPAGASGTHQGERRHSSAREQSIDSIPSQRAYSSRLGNQQKETMVDSSEVNQSSRVSPAVADDNARELSVEEQNCEHDEKLTLVDSIETEGEDHISSETGDDDNLVRPGKKQKLCSQVEQPALHDSGYEDEVRTSNSENSREKCGSSKDYPKRIDNGDEDIQEGHSSQMGYLKSPHKEEDERYLRQNDEYSRNSQQERERNQIVSKGREDAPNSYHHTLRGRSYEGRKVSKSSVSSWQKRDDNLHSRRVKNDDMRQENGDEMLSRQKSKSRVIDRNQKDEDHSRKHIEGGDWRGNNRDEVLRQREKDDIMMIHRENVDDPVIKRKRDEEYLREKADKADTLHRDREDSGRRKRERADGLDLRRREVDSRMRDKSDHLSSKHKDDNWRYREREDRQRLKPNESAATHREREEGRGAIRSGRFTEDKGYQEKERKRHNEHSRRDLAREDNVSQNKGRGEVSVREKHSNGNERNSRHQRLNTYGDHPPSADGQQMYREKRKENARKAKDAEAQNNQGLGKKKHENRHTAHRNEKVFIKGLNEQESNNISSKQHNTMRKQAEADPASDDENQGSRRGRSKLERWTSHKGRGYDATDNTKTLSASSKAEKIEGDNVDVLQEDEQAKTEQNNNALELDAKVADGGLVVNKVVDDQDRHLDTVAKLKRRSERFKLPMPREKEITSNRKLENEVLSSNNESAIDSVVKPERPARKRRWTGS